MSEEIKQNDSDLIIVRRRSDVEFEPPKGGVWKIAHADFMTAMMAFFMVMWLISSTDDVARKSIAEYFNPVKLSELSPFPKGLEDPVEKPKKPAFDEEIETTENGKKREPIKTVLGRKQTGIEEAQSDLKGGFVTNQLPRFAEAEIFSDPFGILDRIMTRSETAMPQRVEEEQDIGLDDKIGKVGGAAMRDPFEPLYWQLAPQHSRLQPEKPMPSETPSLAKSGTRFSVETLGIEQDETLTSTEQQLAQSAEQDNPDPLTDELWKNEPIFEELKSVADQMQKTESTSVKKAQKADALAGEDTKKLEVFKAELTRSLNETMEQAAAHGLSVETSGDDILINAADSPDHHMFAVGSAEPTKPSVLLLEKVAKSLAKVKGQIIIRGHTDGRPFRNADYDNWRLSTARAHMARYMLIRGGLDESRILRVEGYADKALKHPDNPEADDNRRIEILVKPAAEIKS